MGELLSEAPDENNRSIQSIVLSFKKNQNRANICAD